jgi:hypothetical protein
VVTSRPEPSASVARSTESLEAPQGTSSPAPPTAAALSPSVADRVPVTSPSLVVKYLQACGLRLLSSKGSLESRVTKALGSLREDLHVVVVAGYSKQAQEGSGTGILMHGQFRVCRASSATETCLPPTPDCAAACLFNDGELQISNRDDAVDSLADAIAGAITRRDSETRSVCRGL